MAKKSPFEQTADTFEKWGRDYQAVAANTENIASRAAILKEAAHYFACANRMRDAVSSQKEPS